MDFTVVVKGDRERWINGGGFPSGLIVSPVRVFPPAVIVHGLDGAFYGTRFVRSFPYRFSRSPRRNSDGRRESDEEETEEEKEEETKEETKEESKEETGRRGIAI